MYMLDRDYYNVRYEREAADRHHARLRAQQTASEVRQSGFGLPVRRLPSTAVAFGSSEGRKNSGFKYGIVGRDKPRSSRKARKPKRLSNQRRSSRVTQGQRHQTASPNGSGTIRMRVSATPSSDSMWGLGALGGTLHSQTGPTSAGRSTAGPSIARKGRVRSIQGRTGGLVAKQQPLRSLATTFVPSDSIPLDPESLHELGRLARQRKRTASSSSSHRKRGARTSATTGRKRRGSPVLIATLPSPNTAACSPPPKSKGKGKGKGSGKTKRMVRRARNSTNKTRISKQGPKRTQRAARATKAGAAGSELQAVIAAAATAAVRQALGMHSIAVQSDDRLEQASGPVSNAYPKATGVTTGPYPRATSDSRASETAAGPYPRATSDSRASETAAIHDRETGGQLNQEGNGGAGRYKDDWEVEGGDQREGSSRQGYSGRIHAAKLLEERSARMLQAASALASAAALRGQLQGPVAMYHDRQQHRAQVEADRMLQQRAPAGRMASPLSVSPGPSAGVSPVPVRGRREGEVDVRGVAAPSASGSAAVARDNMDGDEASPNGDEASINGDEAAPYVGSRLSIPPLPIPEPKPSGPSVGGSMYSSRRSHSASASASEERGTSRTGSGVESSDARSRPSARMGSARSSTRSQASHRFDEARRRISRSTSGSQDGGSLPNGLHASRGVVEFAPGSSDSEGRRELRREGWRVFAPMIPPSEQPHSAPIDRSARGSIEESNADPRKIAQSAPASPRGSLSLSSSGSDGRYAASEPMMAASSGVPQQMPGSLYSARRSPDPSDQRARASEPTGGKQVYNVSARPVEGSFSSSRRGAQQGRSGSNTSNGRSNRSRRSRRKLKHFGDRAGKAEQGLQRNSRSVRRGSARSRSRSRSSASRYKAMVYDVEVSLPDGVMPAGTPNASSGSSSRIRGRSRASSIHAADGVAGSSARGKVEDIVDDGTGRGGRQADTRADDLSSIQYGVDGRSYEFASVGESGIEDANGVLHTLDGTRSAVSPRQVPGRESSEGPLAAGRGNTRRGSAHSRHDAISEPSFKAAENTKRKKRLDFLVEMSREHEEALEALAQELRLIKLQAEKTDEARKQALLRAVEEAREQQAALSASMRRLGYSEGQAMGRAQGLLDGAAAGLSHAVAAHDVASGSIGFGGVSAAAAGVGAGNSRRIAFGDEEQLQLGVTAGGPTQQASRNGTPTRASGRLGSPARSGGHALDATLGSDYYSRRTPGWVGSPIVRSPAQSVVAPPARLERHGNQQNPLQLDAALLSARLVHWSMSNYTVVPIDQASYLSNSGATEHAQLDLARVVTPSWPLLQLHLATYHSHQEATAMISVDSMLRFSVFLTFVGHGGIALMGGSPKWRNYLATAGIREHKAYTTTFFAVGLLDVVVAIVCLFVWCPVEVITWAAAWGCATAAMRPLSGENLLEFVERGGNFVPAMALVNMVASNQMTSSLLGIRGPAMAVLARSLLPPILVGNLSNGVLAQMVVFVGYLVVLGLISVALRAMGGIKRN